MIFNAGPEQLISYISLGLTCFLVLAVVTHLLVKQKEAKREDRNKTAEFNQKVDSLTSIIDELKTEKTDLLVKFEGERQRLLQLEEETQKRLAELEEKSQKLEELENANTELLIKSQGDNQRILLLENSNKELLVKAETYYQKLQQLEEVNKDYSINVLEKAQRIQQLEDERRRNITESENSTKKIESLEKTNRQLEEKNKDFSINVAEKTQKIQLLEEERQKNITESESSKKKIETLERINQQLLIESEGAKKLQEVSVNSSKFYEEFLNKGLDTDLDNLVKYQDFYEEHFQQIEDWKLQLDLEKNRVKAGKIYEGNWGERIDQLFNSEELDYIELEEQPHSSQGGKADFKLVFRNSRNKQNSTSNIRIMVELKYSFGDVSLDQQFSTTKSDLRKALEVAKYSSEPYHFIFLVTNREFEIEEYSKSETIWVVSDRDYEKFGLGSGRSEGDPIIAVMTPEASFKWIRMLYLLFWLAPTAKRVNVVTQEGGLEKINQKIADFIRECHSLTEDAEGVSVSIFQIVDKLFEDLNKKFKQAKNKLLKSEKTLNNVREKKSNLWGQWKTLSLSFNDQKELKALPSSEEPEV